MFCISSEKQERTFSETITVHNIGICGIYKMLLFILKAYQDLFSSHYKQVSVEIA